MALPITVGKTNIAGIKIHDTRLVRLMEVLLRGGTQLNGWRSADIHQAVLTTFGLPAASYTLTQLRYDLRKMKAHGLVERIGRSYLYRLTDKGVKAALMFILSVGHWPTHCSTTGLTKPSSPTARSKPPSTRLIMPFNVCLIYSPPEILRDEFLDLARLVLSPRLFEEPHPVSVKDSFDVGL